MRPISTIDDLVLRYIEETPDFAYPPSGDTHPSIDNPV